MSSRLKWWSLRYSVGIACTDSAHKQDDDSRAKARKSHCLCTVSWHLCNRSCHQEKQSKWQQQQIPKGLGKTPTARHSYWFLQTLIWSLWTIIPHHVHTRLPHTSALSLTDLLVFLPWPFSPLPWEFSWPLCISSSWVSIFLVSFVLNKYFSTHKTHGQSPWTYQSDLIWPLISLSSWHMLCSPDITSHVWKLDKLGWA